MKIERNRPEDPGDRIVTRVLRDVYASPSSNSSYWDELESRIMARIATAGESVEWWGVFHGWVRIGLAAHDLDRRGDRGAGRPAHQVPGTPGEPPGVVIGPLGRDLGHDVRQRGVVQLRRLLPAQVPVVRMEARFNSAMG